MKQGYHLSCSPPSESPALGSTRRHCWLGGGAALQEMNLQIQTSVSMVPLTHLFPLCQWRAQAGVRGETTMTACTEAGAESERHRNPGWNLDVATPYTWAGTLSNPHFSPSKMEKVISPRAIGRVRDKVYEKLTEKSRSSSADCGLAWTDLSTPEQPSLCMGFLDTWEAHTSLSERRRAQDSARDPPPLLMWLWVAPLS